MKLLIVSKSFVVKSALELYFKNNENIKTVTCKSELDEVNLEVLVESDVLFVELSEKNEIDKVLAIKQLYEYKKIIIFDAEKDLEKLSKSLDNGIEGYITNLNDEEEFNVIAKRILLGKKYYDIDLLLKYTSICSSMNNGRSINDYLTSREKDILKFVSAGLTNKNIADELYLSENTVKKHVTNILNKLKLENRKELILFYKNEIEGRM